MIADNSAASIEAFVKANVKRGTTLITDGHASYPGLTGYRHDPRIVGKMAGHIVLPWIHRAFSLMKRWSLGTYHGLRRKHVDAYLNEFVFRYILCGFTACASRILHTVPCTNFARHSCPAAGPCSRAWRAKSRVVHSSCG